MFTIGVKKRFLELNFSDRIRFLNVHLVV